MSRLRARLIASSALLSLLVVAVATVAVLAVLRTESARQVDTLLSDRAAALTATITVDRAGVVDVVGADEALFDSPNWVFDRLGRRVEGQRPPARLAATIDMLSLSGRTRTRVVGGWHLRATPVRLHGARVAVGVTGVDARPYDASLLTVVRAAVVLGTLGVLGATALAAVVLARSLGPIAAMTTQAASWSRASSHRRFGLGRPKDEVSGLAAVLDELLDRVEDALAAEQRLTAEIAHELRTPLTALRAEAELGLMAAPDPERSAARFARIRDAAVEMSGAMTTLLDSERTTRSPAGSSPVAEVVRLVARRFEVGAVALHVSGDAEIHAAVPADHLGRVVAPLLQNAFAAAAGEVWVVVGATDAEVTVDVSDDGDGVDPSVVSALFESGVTARADGTGLGLGIARRLARAVGGDVVLRSARPAVFQVVLPSVRGDHVR